MHFPLLYQFGGCIFGFGLVLVLLVFFIVYICGNMVKGKRKKRVEKGKRRLRVN